jgi:hypothetical protein
MDASNYHDIKSFLHKLYANPSNGECPILTDTRTHRRGTSPFGCLSSILGGSRQ